MAWINLPTNYTDAIWDGLKRYLQLDNNDGTVSFQDVTAYINREKSFFGAKDANRMNEAMNIIMARMDKDDGKGIVFEREIVIPVEGWKTTDELGDEKYCIAIPQTDITEKTIAMVNMYAESLETAENCGLNGVCCTLEEVLKLYAESVPTQQMKATVLYINASDESNNSGNDTDGMLGYEVATTEDVTNMLNDVLQDSDEVYDENKLLKLEALKLCVQTLKSESSNGNSALEIVDTVPNIETAKPNTIYIVVNEQNDDFDMYMKIGETIKQLGGSTDSVPDIVNSKFDKTGGTISGNVIINGSVTEGNSLVANISNYESAHAEGEYTTTFGRYVHAEGGGCVASSDGGHAEGAQTIAGGLVLQIKNVDAENKIIVFDDTTPNFSTVFNTIVSNTKLHIINEYYSNSATRVTVESVDATNYSIIAKEIIPSSNFNPRHAAVLANYNSVRNVHAEGRKTIASGNCSHAEGNNTTASGESSHAEGGYPTASGDFSHAEGFNTKASGIVSHAEGYATTASGYHSHAEGNNTIASGERSHAEGGYTRANGDFSHAEGESTIASGPHSHAEGWLTRANGEYSHAGSYNTIANNFQTSIGKCNVNTTGGTESGTSGSVFVVGNGTSDSARSNCFRVQFDGQTYAKGSYSSSGADYAEYFQWQDRNVNNEDRVGLFVTLDGEEIKIANPDDNYILGIVSARPSVVGDVYDDQWKDMYLTDVFGREILEEIDVPAEIIEAPDPDNPQNTITKVIKEAHREIAPKLNPNYNGNEKYIPRSKRPEWSAVGMLGKLVVVDDGTCQVNGWCKVGEGGIATKSRARTNYRVMARLDDTHIKILVV